MHEHGVATDEKQCHF